MGKFCMKRFIRETRCLINSANYYCYLINMPHIQFQINKYYHVRRQWKKEGKYIVHRMLKHMKKNAWFFQNDKYT